MSELNQGGGGSESSFEELYRLYSDAIFRFCVSQVREPEIAADITGDVFVRAFEAYQRKPPDSDGARSWLFRIARNAIIDHGRTVSRWRRLIDTAFHGPQSAESVETSAQLNQDLREVIAAIAKLKPREQTLVGLRLSAGLPFDEIGKVVGISAANAQVATGRAVQRLREIIEADR